MKNLILLSLITLGLSTSVQAQIRKPTLFGQAEDLPLCGSQEHTDKLLAFIIHLATKATPQEKELYKAILKRHLNDFEIIKLKADIDYLGNEEIQNLSEPVIDNILGCKGSGAWARRIIAIVEGREPKEVEVEDLTDLVKEALRGLPRSDLI